MGPKPPPMSGAVTRKRRGGEIHQRIDRLREVVRLLRRRPHLDAVVARTEFRQDAAAFDRMAAAAMLPQLLAEHVTRLAERRVGIAVADPVGGHQIRRELAPDRRCGRVDCHPAIDARPAGSRSRPRPARRRLRRHSGPRRAPARPPRPHRRPRRRRARRPSSGRAGSPSSSGAACGAVSSTGVRSSRVSTACTPGSASAASLAMRRTSACG